MGNYFDKMLKGELSEKIADKSVKMAKKTMLKHKEMGEGNAFTGARCKAICAGDTEFTFDGKTKKLRNVNNSDYKSCGCKKVEENVLRMSENELVDFIEEMVNEASDPPGLVTYKRAHKESGGETKKYMKDLEKKMKDYLKDGSKGKYEMSPSRFPAGNGELGKMSKKAYTPSGAVEEYIENFAYSPGMENLQYDEIQPNDDWLTANLEGSSKTGNSSKYANAVDTGFGKKINAKRKKNLYGVEKNRSYNRYTQPVDNAGESKGAKKLNNMFKDLNVKESEEKKNMVINEELSKMSKLISYNQKTQ